MASGPGSSVMFLAGFANGAVKVFDRRLEDEDALVRSYSEHGSWVQKVKWHPTVPGQFLSGRYDYVLMVVFGRESNGSQYDSLDGEVKLWDLRGTDHPVDKWFIHHGGLATFDVHPLTGVFAA